MSKPPTKQHGFTIVELLIVIVVIAILAAITIVAYNGISIRAENTKTIAALKQYSDGIAMYQAVNGQYPIASYVCLGAPDSKCGQVTDGASTCVGIGGLVSNATFDNTMIATLGKLPQLSAQNMNCGGKMYAGALYYSDGKGALVYYVLRGNQQCSSIGIFYLSSRTQQNDTTFCITYLPALP